MLYRPSGPDLCYKYIAYNLKELRKIDRVNIKQLSLDIAADYTEGEHLGYFIATWLKTELYHRQRDRRIVLECETKRVTDDGESRSVIDLATRSFWGVEPLSQEDLLIVKDIVDKLGGGDTNLIMMLVASGYMSEREGAAELDIPPSTFQRRMKVFRRRVEKLLSD